MDEKNETARLEAFSDGVFAIAITLLVLDLHAPDSQPDGTSLISALLTQWPVYFGFLTSFATIGIMWINHHRMFSLIQCSDHTLLILNLLLLLGITFVPFPTSLVADYIGKPGEQAAALVYIGTFVLIALCFNALWLYASRGRRLIGNAMDDHAVAEITRQYRFGPFIYAIAFIVAWVQPTAGMVITFLLAIYFAIPKAIL